MSRSTAQSIIASFSSTPVTWALVLPPLYVSTARVCAQCARVMVPPYCGAVNCLPLDGSVTISFSAIASEASSPSPAAQAPVAVRAIAAQTARSRVEVAMS